MKFSTTTLTVAGFSAKIMEADRLVGDQVFALPPGRALEAYRVTQFNRCPEHWVKDDGSWIVVVKPNKGLWFDWRNNDQYNTAILPSVKGCNPITGEETRGFGLVEYVGGLSACPKHPDEMLNIKRYCTKCGYEHPAQNYVSSPNPLWWDGFRADDGTVRQFFFSEDEMRDVASHLIGKENTVPAFGFAFYSKKPEHIVRMSSAEVRCKGISASLGSDDMGGYSSGNYKSFNGITKGAAPRALYRANTSPSFSCSVSNIESDNCVLNSFSDNVLMDEMHSRSLTKSVSVGAGAKINQTLRADAGDITNWNTDPDAVMRIYFIFEDEFNKWRKFGMKCLEDVEPGMLKGIPVG